MNGILTDRRGDVSFEHCTATPLAKGDEHLRGVVAGDEHGELVAGTIRSRGIRHDAENLAGVGRQLGGLLQRDLDNAERSLNAVVNERPIERK